MAVPARDTISSECITIATAVGMIGVIADKTALTTIATVATALVHARHAIGTMAMATFGETVVATAIVRQAIEIVATPPTGRAGLPPLRRIETTFLSVAGTPGHGPIRSDTERGRQKI